MERLMAWIPEHVPADDETTVVHGDFRLGNSIVDPSEPRIAAVSTGSWRPGTRCRPRVQRHALHLGLTSWRRSRPGSEGARHPDGGGYLAPTAAARERTAFRIGASTSRFRCSGSPRSRRGSWVAYGRHATTPRRARAESGRGRWPRRLGDRRGSQVIEKRVFGGRVTRAQ